MGLPTPSEFIRSRLRQSPLLPGARGAAPLAATAKKQQALITKQRAQIDSLKRTSIERAQKGKLISQAQRRVADLKSTQEAELQRYEDQLAAVEKMLERRDMADEMRKKLEEQAAEYEAQIDKLQQPAAAVAAETRTTSEPMAAEQVEAEQDDAASAYPSGAPGDVEFAEAGT
jgi:vacuolar-type H+-ATPase subunit I/STV1